ncbi:MAG: hypothetical protein K0S41_4267 [Anaerocolumna sp.]|jgi:hypothetical protein|nr:hypothetical protein [Anaerocolumna sp.]
MRVKYSKRLSACILLTIIGLSLSSSYKISSSETHSANLNLIVNGKSNPIDEWYLNMDKQYGNSHTDGWISYLYGEAWKAELQHLIDEYNSETADNYFDSVVNEANAINKLLMEQEVKNGWGTGAPGRVELASAIIYKNGVYQLEANYSDFIFDVDAVTQEYFDGN